MSMRESMMKDTIEELDSLTIDELLQLAEEGVYVVISNGHIVGMEVER